MSPPVDDDGRELAPVEEFFVADLRSAEAEPDPARPVEPEEE